MLGNEMLRRTQADRRIVQFAGLLVDVFDEAFDICRRRIFWDNNDEGGVGEYSDRLEILHRVVGHLLDHDRRNGMAHADGEEIVSVLRCLGGDATGDRAASTGAIFDDELLTKGLGQTVGQNARCDIRSAAGAKPDQDVNWLRRPILCVCRRRGSRQNQTNGDGRRKIGAFHDRPPSVRRASPTGARLLLLFRERARTPRCQREGQSYFSSAMGLRKTPTFSISISQVSPAFIQTGSGLRAWPTPDGVPVRMTSPGSSVMPLVR